MKAWTFIILLAVLLAGCGRQDPIERVVYRASHEFLLSYPFKQIDLPETATPEQLIAALSKRSTSELGHFGFTVHKIVETQSVKTEPPSSEKYTAVLLATSDGQKVVLLRPLTLGRKWDGWYYRIYDAK